MQKLNITTTTTTTTTTSCSNKLRSSAIRKICSNLVGLLQCRQRR